jgi:diguanylate cyclase (GGDEF)-like protein/PAS domain S-box-containing protein
MDILVFCDNPKDFQWIEQMLGLSPGDDLRLLAAFHLDEGLERLHREDFDVILIYRSGWAELESDLKKILARVAAVSFSQAHQPQIVRPGDSRQWLPVIAISESGGWGERTHALQAGALDYLSRLQVANGVLRPALDKAVQVRRLQKDLLAYREQVDAVSGLIGDFAISLAVHSGGLVEVEWVIGRYPDGLLPKDDLNPDVDFLAQTIHPQDRSRVFQFIDTILNGHPAEVEFRFRNREGGETWIWQSGSPQFDETGRLVRILGTGADITNRRYLDQRLKERLEVEDLAVTLLARFINLPVDQVDEQLQSALSTIGRFARAETVYLDARMGFHPNEKSPFVEYYYQWDATVVESSQWSDSFPRLEELPWLKSRLERFETVTVSSLDEVPGLAALQRAAPEEALNQRSRSYLAVPLVLHQQLMGVLGLTRDNTNGPWKPDDARLLRLMADVLVNAIDRWRSDEALLESEAQYRLLVNSIQDVICLHQIDGKVVYISPSVEKMFGRTVEEMTGANLFDLVHPDDRERVQTFVSEHVQNGLGCTYQARSQLPRGETIWIETTISLILNDQGEVDRLLSTTRDFSIHKQAEQILRQAKQERDQLMSSVADALWSADVTSSGRWSYRYLSPVIERITGYPVEDFIRQPRLTVEMILEEDRPAAMQKFVRMNRAIQPKLEIEYRIRKRDGTVRWVRDSQMATRLDEYTVRLDGVLSDVTDRKLAEEEIQQAHEELRFVTSSVSDFLWSAELDSSLALTARYISPVAEKITGQPPEFLLENMSERWLGILYPEDRPLWTQALESILHGTHEYELEYRIIRADRAVRWVRDSVRARPAGAQHFSLNGVVTDITERKITEQALQEANERLQNSIIQMEERNQQISLINEMGDLMQSCLKVTDVYEIMSAYGTRLFPGHSGAVYMLDDRKRLVEAAAVWGNDLHSELLFEPEDCWALRRGRVHTVGSPGNELDCPHTNSRFHSPYSCIPMIAHGDTLGSFYLQCDSTGRSHTRCRETAILVAERVALALANLRLHESLQDQSIRDSLTGLFNRRYMEDTTERELRQAARHQYGLGIMIMDIDFFKTFNDTQGHGAGDSLLQALGEYLQTSVRAGDIACRYGGDEFVVVMPDATLIDTSERAQQLQQGIRRLHVNYHGQPLGSISVSMGVAAFPDHGESLEQLLRMADKALYRAKDQGKDRVMVA